MLQRLMVGVFGLMLVLSAGEARAFCGFFVASAGAELYNETSQVAVLREGERTVMNMEFNYKGALKEFALVLPVPVVLGEKDVRIIRPDLFRKLDAYSAPRLVDYPAKDPCARKKVRRSRGKKKSKKASLGGGGGDLTDEELGVTVEARFEVEEYEIVILSAKESNGLETWLNQTGYAIPEGSAPFYTPYIERGMFFFVVRVNLDKLQTIQLPVDANGYQTLRPLQFEYQAETFMLPIQLGKVNARDEQHLVLYLISPEGRYKVANYNNVDIPTNLHVDAKYKSDPEGFQAFYKNLIETAAMRAEQESVLTEYVWKISSCDPCPTQPPSAQELAELGANVKVVRKRRGKRRGKRRPTKLPIEFNNGSGGLDNANNYYDYVVTRFRASYAPDGFLKDLELERDSAGSVRFQGRYIIQFPWEGETPCLDDEQRLELVRQLKLVPRTDAEEKAAAAVRNDPTFWAEAWMEGGVQPEGRAEVPAPAEATAKDEPAPAEAQPASGEGGGAAATTAPTETPAQPRDASGEGATMCSVGPLRDGGNAPGPRGLLWVVVLGCVGLRVRRSA